MAIDVKYAGDTITTLDQDGIVVATTAGNYCKDNLTIECTDALFVPMPPDESYEREWTIRDTNYIPDVSMSATFTHSPYLTLRIRKLPPDFDKDKYRFEVLVVGDYTHTNYVRDITQLDTEVRVTFGVNYASDLSSKMIENIYYDNVLVGQYNFSYGGYIRATWEMVTEKNKKFFRAFWAYALAAKENFNN